MVGILARPRCPARHGLALAAVMWLTLACGGSPVVPAGTASGCLDRAVFGPPAESPYVLPYPVGARYEVLQAYCYDRGSHGNQLAYDFLMNEGSPVTAARAGIVAGLEDRWPDSDWDSSHFNYLLIRHDDGSVAFYAHLRLGSMQVRLGDAVDAGDRIADSGHCGTPIADLHFGVYRSWPPAEGADLPVGFRNAEGPLDSRGGLRAGTSYTALPY
jgi:murein DD-endopeptidase MepM/ murein hydrolase activator NlpD